MQQPDARQPFGARNMDPHARLVLEGLLAGKQGELDVEDRAREHRARPGQDVAARHLVHLQPREVHGRAAPRRHPVHRPAVDLQAAHARAAAGGKDLQLLAALQAAGDERPGHDRPEAAEAENAVDGQAQQAVGRPLGRLPRHVEQALPQAVQPVPGPGRYLQDGSALQEGAGEQLPHLHLGQGLRLGVGEVALGEGHEPPRDPQQLADVDVLARLGHDRLVGGHDEHDGVDAVRAGEHVAHEALVAGNVDEGGHDTAAQVRMGEAEVDGDPPLLFLLQPVGIGAGEGEDERALAVIYVAGGTDDERAHMGRLLLPGGGYAEHRLGRLVKLGGQGEPRFLFRPHDEGIVLPRHLDEEQQLVPREVEDDAVLVLVEEALEELVAQTKPGLLFLVGDEVVFLARDLLQEDQLPPREVQGDAADFRHSSSLVPG